MAKTLNPGDEAPQFSLVDQNGKTVKLSDFRGRRVLLYFYPRADTPGCTTQACSVRDARSELAAAGTEAVGISPDAPEKQKRFDGKYALGFPLLSDADHAVAAAYGVWGEKSMVGKKVEGITRSSFLIDEKGKILALWYKVSPKETVPNAREVLEKG
jgi:peroxiredoxin Q/BCP